MAKVDSITVNLDKAIRDFGEAAGFNTETARGYTRAFSAVRSVSIPIKIIYSRYGRYKLKQLCGMRLTRAQRKFVWNLEHRAH